MDNKGIIQSLVTEIKIGIYLLAKEMGWFLNKLLLENEINNLQWPFLQNITFYEPNLLCLWVYVSYLKTARDLRIIPPKT